jgi:hypothetical protein
MAVADHSTIHADVAPDCVVGLLQHAARTIDQMWREAQVEGEHPAAVALGEASYGVHRALIALQSIPPPGSALS